MRIGLHAGRPERTSSGYVGLEAIESRRLRKAYDFKTDGDRYLWAYGKLQELRAADRDAGWADAGRILAHQPVSRSHRREILAARRKPLPARTLGKRP
jgi:hypothetical protein